MLEPSCEGYIPWLTNQFSSPPTAHVCVDSMLSWRRRHVHLRRCVLELRSFYRVRDNPRRSSRNADWPARRERECAPRGISFPCIGARQNVRAYHPFPRPEVRLFHQDHQRSEAGNKYALPARAREVPRGCQSRHSASTMCHRGETTGVCDCARSLCLRPLTERIDSNMICWSRLSGCIFVIETDCLCFYGFASFVFVSPIRFLLWDLRNRKRCFRQTRTQPRPLIS